MYSKKDRALQMNLGASRTSGKVIFFLHADTQLNPTVFPIIREIRKNQLIGGCFSSFLAGVNKIFRLIDCLGQQRKN